jgi:hypothetical protein
MYSFQNSILIVVFNFSHCLNNKEFLRNLYKNHFKTIIFYSDCPVIEDEEVNFVDIQAGCNTHKIFKHFYTKYKSLVDTSDGIFYTMDDNIINLNILNLYDNHKILVSCNPQNLRDLSEYSGWHWDLPWGKDAINILMKDERFTEYNINKFIGAFADWFYLPKKYLNDKLFDLFELFAEYKVFLEIAIPSIIHYTESDKSFYNNNISEDILWGADRQSLQSESYIYRTFHHKHNLIVHPIKFNQNPHTKDYLRTIFCKERCVIITTINKPTEAILKHINNVDYDVIIVGDLKTPDDYKELNCIFLDTTAQQKLFPELSELIPYNHYSRKNLGYLYAVKKGYKVIYETDDDNIPHNDFDNVLKLENKQILSELNSKWINVFKHFTDNENIWPRGLPISLIKHKHKHCICHTTHTPSVINGLVENEPDVDALYRLTTKNSEINWKADESVLIDNKNICIFNTQNTFWLDSEVFLCLLVPTSVSFRYCDILRAIICNIIFQKLDKYMMYTSPNVVQIRNDHNLINDLTLEMEMYIHNENILNYLHMTDEQKTTKELLLTIYEQLYVHNVVDIKDINILKIWQQYF